MNRKIEIKYLRPRAELEYKTEHAAAMDLMALAINGDDFSEWVIGPGQTIRVGTGVALHLGSGLAALVLPRSGLGSRGIVPRNTPGLIDGDYQGEIIVALYNGSNESFKISRGDRVAQLMLTTYIHPTLVTVTEFSVETTRGDGGFGHTGN